MSFNPGGSNGISGAADVALNNPSGGDQLTYEAATAKWRNYTPANALDIRQFGVVFDGTSTTPTDNHDRIHTALLAAQSAKRSLYVPDIGVLGFSGSLQVPLGVSLLGAGWSKSSTSPRTKFLCLSSDAQILIGGTSSSLQGGRYGNFEIDGNDLATQPLKIGFISEAWFDPILVHNAAGTGAGGVNECAVLISQTQNSVFAQLVVENNAGSGIVIDAGAGGLRFLNYEVADYGAYAVEILQTVDGATTPYPVPTNIVFEQGILERGDAGCSGHLNYRAGSDVTFGAGTVFAEPNSTTVRSMVTMRNDGINATTGLRFRSVKLSGSPLTSTAFDIGDTCNLILEGRSRLIGVKYAFKLAANANVEDDGLLYNSAQAIIDPASAGSIEQNISRSFRAGLDLYRSDPTATTQQTAVDLVYIVVSSTTNTGITTLTRVSGSVFGLANVNAKITVTGLGPSGNSLSTTIATVANDGLSCTLASAATADGSSVIARFSERYPRWRQHADGSQYFGTGAANAYSTLSLDQTSSKLQLTLPSGRVMPWAMSATSLVKQTGDETQQVTNSTAFVGDNRLIVALASNVSYEVALTVYYDGPTTGAAQFGWIYPAGSTGQWGMTAPQVGSSNSSMNPAVISTGRNLGQPSSAGTIGTGSIMVAQLYGTITTASTAGQLQLRWTQLAADASGSLTVRAASLLKVTPLS